MNQKCLQKEIQQYILNIENSKDGDGLLFIKLTNKKYGLVNLSLSKHNKRYFLEVAGKSTELTEVQAEIFEAQKLFLSR